MGIMKGSMQYIGIYGDCARAIGLVMSLLGIMYDDAYKPFRDHVALPQGHMGCVRTCL